MTADNAAPGVGDAGGSVSIGKGAWDCDRRCKIPPEKEAGYIKSADQIPTTVSHERSVRSVVLDCSSATPAHSANSMTEHAGV
jgi:hypothetical protein